MYKKQKATYSLPTYVIEALKLESKNRGLNMSVLVQLALEEFLRKEEQGAKE